MRLAALIALLAWPSYAWTPGGSGSPDQWHELVEAVRERCEATRYSTNAHEVAPRDYQQSVRMPLGIVANNYVDPWSVFFPPLVEVGPVVCETNISSGVTNIWCWTNHVALDTDYISYSNGEWSVDAFQPYGPQYATNLVWTNADPRLTGYELPVVWTAMPSPALVNQMDEDLKAVAVRYVDTVAISNAGGVEAYFSANPSTNWTWTDTDGDEIGDSWQNEVIYPSTFPTYTLSNLWRYSGIEPYTYPSEIVTQAVERFGWEVGQLGTYSVEEEHVLTNRVTRYDFTSAPTATPWKVTLGQVWLRITNSVTTVETNDNHTITRREDHIGAIPAKGQRVPSNMVPRLLMGLDAPTNRLHLVPPGTGEVWRTLYPDEWQVTITGVRVDTGPVYRARAANVTGTVAELTWASSSTVATARIGVWLAADLSMPEFSFAEVYVWSNSALVASPTASVAGTSFELVAEGSSYEVGDMASLWRPSLAAWRERSAIVSNLQWIADLPVLITGEWDGWQGFGNTIVPLENANYYWHRLRGYKSYCIGSATNDDCGTDSTGVYLWQLPQPYTSRPVGFTGNVEMAWSYDVGGSYAETEYPTGARYESFWKPSLFWPDSISYSVTGLTDRISVDVDYYGRLVGGEGWPKSYTNTFYDRAQDEVREHVQTFDFDVIGPAQRWPMRIATTEATGGRALLSVDPVSINPSPYWYQTWSDGYTADAGDGMTTITYKETVQQANTTARTLTPIWLYRFRFKHLAP